MVYGGHTAADAAALIDAYRTAGIPAKLIGPGSLTETVDLTKLAGLPAEVYTSMFYASDLDNDAQPTVFVAGYHKAHGVAPSSYAAAGYDSAAILARAVARQNGAATADVLNKTLGSLGQIDSPRGVWTFNGNRSPAAAVVPAPAAGRRHGAGEPGRHRPDRAELTSIPGSPGRPRTRTGRTASGTGPAPGRAAPRSGRRSAAAARSSAYGQGP